MGPLVSLKYSEVFSGDVSKHQSVTPGDGWAKNLTPWMGVFWSAVVGYR